MSRLDTFYKSKRWINLCDQLRLERLNEDGQLICEYCGQPILQKYDCIGHHKTELTEENVDDAEISLNPENIILIHFRCHNKIHQRFEGYQQKVYIVYGPPCSGKTTFVQNNAERDDLILDLDRIWEAISISDRYHKPKRLRANVFGIRDALIDQIRTRTGQWRNAYIIGTYPLRTDRDRLAELLRAETIFIDTSMDECISRAPNDDWKRFICEWFEDFTE